MEYGISLANNKVKLFIGKLPGRKQECFYFVENETSIFPIAYISSRNLAEIKRLWNELIQGIPMRKEN